MSDPSDWKAGQRITLRVAGVIAFSEAAKRALSSEAQPLSSETRSGSDSAPATDREIIFSPPTEEEGTP